MEESREILVINGHDYSKYVKRKGLKWKRNDVDSNKSKRIKDDARMRRYKLGTKRSLPYTMLDMPVELARQLDTDLSAEYFDATYLDLHGKMTKEFYCTTFNACLVEVREDGKETWTDISFEMTEV